MLFFVFAKGIYREYEDTKEAIKEVKVVVKEERNNDRNEGVVKFNYVIE